MKYYVLIPSGMTFWLALAICRDLLRFRTLFFSYNNFVWELTYIHFCCSFLYEIRFPKLLEGEVVQGRVSERAGPPLALLLCRAGGDGQLGF